MQYYGMDSIAARKPATPFDFSIDPDDGSFSHADGHLAVAAAENFFYYHSLGNVGFIGFSNAHAYDDAHFREACAHFARQEEEEGASPPAAIYLLGHWNVPLLGCPLRQATPEVFKRVRRLPGCDRGTLRFAMGHYHCNQPAKVPDGYLLGGTGVRGFGCDEFGFAFVDTTGGRELVGYFHLANTTYDRYEEVLACLEGKGVASCLGLATIWRNSSLA